MNLAKSIFIAKQQPACAIQKLRLCISRLALYNRFKFGIRFRKITVLHQLLDFFKLHLFTFGSVFREAQ